MPFLENFSKTAPLDQYITIKEEDSGVHFMMKLKTERTEMDMMI